MLYAIYCKFLKEHSIKLYNSFKEILLSFKIFSHSAIPNFYSIKYGTILYFQLKIRIFIEFYLKLG